MQILREWQGQPRCLLRQCVSTVNFELDMFTSSQELDSLPIHVPIRFRNTTCPYCAANLAEVERTREHVVGRRFVPRGKHDKQWNLLLFACRKCNNKKSELEDDISAISMQPDSFGRFADDDSVLREEAARKAKNSILISQPNMSYCVNRA